MYLIRIFTFKILDTLWKTEANMFFPFSWSTICQQFPSIYIQTFCCSAFSYSFFFYLTETFLCLSITLDYGEIFVSYLLILFLIPSLLPTINEIMNSCSGTSDPSSLTSGWSEDLVTAVSAADAALHFHLRWSEAICSTKWQRPFLNWQERGESLYLSWHRLP